jgi:predicted transport protein
MDKLVQSIEVIRQKLAAWRRQSLKETSTRTIVIAPLLKALGWDVQEPDEVQEEYPIYGGKSVDYAMKLLNKGTVLLIEAKPLDDTLEDEKGVAQVVSYAASAGIDWCILTNGVKWRVYRTVERCPAPDKLMFEVSLDPDESKGMTVEQIAERMWCFSREGMTKGTLNDLGEQIFTDGKVRKALHILKADPSRALVNLVRKAVGDENLTRQQIKDSLMRIADETSATEVSTGTGETLKALEAFCDRFEGVTPRERTIPAYAKKLNETAWTAEDLKPAEVALLRSIGVEVVTVAEHKPSATGQTSRSRGAIQAQKRRRAKKDESSYDETHHLSGKPQEAIQLYRAIDHLCMSFDPSDVSRRYLAKSINYQLGKRCFCSVHILRGGPKVWLQLKYQHIENPPPFARDVSIKGHWGTGDTELHITNRSEFDTAAGLIRRSFESVE